MRTDVKIGVAAGLLIVIAFVVYHVVVKTGQQDANTVDPELASTDDGRGEAPTGDGMVLPRFGGSADGGTPPVTPSVPPVVVTPTPAEPPVTPTIREPPAPVEPPVTPVIPVTPTPVEPPVTPVITPSVPSVPTVPPPSVPSVPSVPSLGGVARTYVVQKGDAGFWAIAEKVYGDGRLWTLLQKANPGVDSNALAPGKKLTVPPRPVRPSAPVAGANGLVALANGSRQYVVKKGDAGFWGIAQSVYGNGKYWTLIAKANPSINSTNLKPGNRLVIPAKPVAGSRPAAGAVAIVPGSLGQAYVVQKSDVAGFWGIAKKVYGDGRYWQVIAKANPSANSSALKVGQKLRVPKLTNAIRHATVSPASTRPAAPPRRPANVEDIGRTPSF